MFRRCVGLIRKDFFCVLHIPSNTTIFHLVVQQVYSYVFRPLCGPSSGCDLTYRAAIQDVWGVLLGYWVFGRVNGRISLFQ